MLYNCEQREKRNKQQEEQLGAEGTQIHGNDLTPNDEEQEKTENPAKDQSEDMESKENAH